MRFVWISNKVISLCEQNKIQGFTSSLIIANIYYILKKLSSHKKTILAITKIRSIINILSLTDKEIGESISAEFQDFEDGIQYFIAINNVTAQVHFYKGLKKTI